MCWRSDSLSTAINGWLEHASTTPATREELAYGTEANRKDHMSPVQLPHVASGKVRDIYELDDKHLLFVTSDRMSAFDVVMAEPIPDKGRVLTAITAFWVERLAGVAPSHLVGLDVPAGVAAGDDGGDLVGRVMVVR